MSNCKKKPFPNRKEALAAKNRYNKRFKKKATSVYRCPYCGFWHFTTMQAKKARAQRAWHIQQREQ